MTLMQRAAQVSREIEVSGKATAFANYAVCLAMAKGDAVHASQMFAARCPNSIHKELVTKAAVAAGTTADASWAAPIAELQPLASAFIEYLRPLSVLGQLEASFRRVPFNVKLPLADEWQLGFLDRAGSSGSGVAVGVRERLVPVRENRRHCRLQQRAGAVIRSRRGRPNLDFSRSRKDITTRRNF